MKIEMWIMFQFEITWTTKIIMTGGVPLPLSGGEEMCAPSPLEGEGWGEGE